MDNLLISIIRCVRSAYLLRLTCAVRSEMIWRLRILDCRGGNPTDLRRIGSPFTMTSSAVCTDHVAEPPLKGLSKTQVVLLWLALTLALAPIVYFIRAAATEVTRYQVSTFEPYAREALAQRNYGRAIELCTGAVKSGVNRNDHWGKVFSLRSQAYAGQGNLPAALAELESAAAFWTRYYYYAKEDERAEIAEFGRGLFRKLMERGDTEAALRALSAAGVAGGRPVEFLQDCVAFLMPAEKEALWVNEPFLILREFSRPDMDVFSAIAEEQDRTLRGSRIDPNGSRAGGPCALLELSDGPKEGRSWYGVDMFLPLSETPFALAVYAKEETPSDLGILLSYWLESSRKSAKTIDQTAQILEDGWKRFDIRRDFYAERAAEANQAGYLVSEGIINKVGLSLAPGPANRIWVDRIELYLPSREAVAQSAAPPAPAG